MGSQISIALILKCSEENLEEAGERGTVQMFTVGPSETAVDLGYIT